jgi:acyl-CoA dehydrogenase
LDFEFSSEQEQLRDSVRRFLADQAPIPYVRAMYDDDRGFTDLVWQGLADLGVVGLLAPEGRGGAGQGMVDMAVVVEELGRAVHPGPFVSSAIGAVSLVDALGAWDAHPRLGGVATGDQIGTVALFEPGRRARIDAPATSATSVGNEWRVSGTKVHVPDARAADVLLVVAALGEGLGVFAVAAKDTEITPTPTVDGSHKQGTVRLHDTPAQRLGSGDATDAVAATLDRLHIAAVVDGVGAAARALELSVDYARERRQFGAPIGSFQAVQHLCADMLRAVELARAAGYYACWAADCAGPAERHRAATLALAFAADELAGVGAATIQVHGGIGFTWEHDAHLFYKRLLTLQRCGGGSVDQLGELASILLD